VKNYTEDSAANDEFQTANSGLHHGELVRDLLGHRLQVPAFPEDNTPRPELDKLIRASVAPRSLLVLEAPAGYGKTRSLVNALATDDSGIDQLRWIP